MAKKLIVHTVHGTWPNGPWGWQLWKPFRRFFRSRPKWYEKDSAFCRAIERNTSAQLIFAPFTWDGSNSFKARAQAATDLREHLKGWFCKESEAKHVIVAHSHGGTVAITATTDPSSPVVEKNSMNDGAVGSPLAGIITLATPFVALRELPTERPSVASAYGREANMYLSSTFLKYLFPLSLIIWWQFGFRNFAIFFIILSSLARIVNVRSRRNSFRKLLAAQFNDPKYQFPLIALRAPSDEASMTIALTLSFDFVVTRLWIYAVYLLCAANMFVGVYSLVKYGWTSRLYESWGEICLVFMVLFLFTHMFTAILMAFAMGPEILDYAGFAEIHSEALPPATCAFVDMLALADAERKRFRHSLHEFESTQARIGYWLDHIVNNSEMKLRNSNLLAGSQLNPVR